MTSTDVMCSYPELVRLAPTVDIILLTRRMLLLLAVPGINLTAFAPLPLSSFLATRQTWTNFCSQIHKLTFCIVVSTESSLNYMPWSNLDVGL